MSRRRSNDEGTRIMAAGVLGTLGADARAAVPVLEEMAKERSPKLRCEVKAIREADD